jgi:hypothetical protein
LSFCNAVIEQLNSYMEKNEDHLEIPTALDSIDAKLVKIDFKPENQVVIYKSESATRTYPDGSLFIGNLKDNQAYGWGSHYYASGNSYEGE